ncbi:MAG: hypothetical protein WC867_06985 [Candidatus Pacearchaeota archaeon]|jgi:hypothetical protein
MVKKGIECKTIVKGYWMSVIGVLTVSCFIFSLLLLSPGFTGYVVSDLENSNYFYSGLVLFILGILGSVTYVRLRNI